MICLPSVLPLLVTVTPAPAAPPSEHLEHAEEEKGPPLPAVTFAQALGLAAGAPDVAGLRAAARAKQEFNDRISALTQNPQLSVEPGFRFRPVSGRQPEALVELAQPFSLAGHGRARRAAARAEEAVSWSQARAAELERRLWIARAWIDLWAAERTLADLRSETEIAAQLERLVERTTALGASTRADLAEARAYLAEARLALLDAEGVVFDQGLGLARLLARPAPGPIRTEGDLPRPPLPPPTALAAVAGALDRLPTARVRLLQARADRAREAEERAAAGGTVGVGASLLRDAPGGLVLSALVRLTPPLFDRGERERGTLAAAAEAREGEARAALIDARAELASSLHERAHSAAIAAELRDRLVPAAREAAQLRRRIYEQGGATLFEVLQAQRQAITAATRLARGLSALSWAEVKLWLLVAAIDEGGT